MSFFSKMFEAPKQEQNGVNTAGLETAQARYFEVLRVSGLSAEEVGAALALQKLGNERLSQQL